jgi:hypothetical protein
MSELWKSSQKVELWRKHVAHIEANLRPPKSPWYRRLWDWTVGDRGEYVTPRPAPMPPPPLAKAERHEKTCDHRGAQVIMLGKAMGNGQGPNRRLARRLSGIEATECPDCGMVWAAIR